MLLHLSGAGEVLLDGENIKNLKLEWLRSQIGLVTQEPALLSLSIRDNIAYGRDATMDQIEEAAKIAHAHTFISSLEKGYETQVNFKQVPFFSPLFLPQKINILFISGGEGWFSFDRRAKDKTIYC